MQNGYERLLEMLNNSSAQKYLRANPFTKTDGVDFNGTISQDMFFDRFYASSSKSEILLQDITQEVADNPQSTIVLQGYSGCGKTTFLHYILYKNFPNSSIVDFEIGIDNTQADPVRQKIQYLLCENIFNDIKDGNATVLKNFLAVFCNNYSNNHAITKFLDTNFKIRSATKRILDLLNQFSKNNDEQNEEYKVILMEAVDVCLSTLDVMQILAFYVFWDISEKVSQNRPLNNLFCFDNLDNIDIDKAKVFVKYFSQFWINLINALSALNIPGYEGVELVKGYGFILSLRETTYAKLTEHFNDNTSKSVLSEFSLNEIYSHKNIISKRTDFLEEYHNLIENEALYQEVKNIEKLIRNEYIEKNIFPLFNNSYNMAVKTISATSKKYPTFIEEYNEITNLKNKKFYRGANAIILKMFFNYFKERGYFNDNLQLYDFSREENQKYLFSPARLILTYLSNISGSCSFYRLVRDFDGIIDINDIANILDKLYLLRYSSWRHLITFDKYPPSDQTGLQRQIDLYIQGCPEDDTRYCIFEITCAGRIYLKTMASHFEFYSTRLSRNKGIARSLFSGQNIIVDPNTQQYRFQTMIFKVYQAVLSCCERLKRADEAICKQRGWTLNQFYTSEFVFKDPERGTKQFHGERLVFNHIGYINIYRQYLLSLDVNTDTKITWNRILVNFINDYLKIYENNLCSKSYLNADVAKSLRTQINKIIDSNYEDFTTLIETEAYNQKFNY